MIQIAGNRWHLDCFRCHSCGTLLDSDANLLLLGDGSLICNNCSYTCTACGNKIDDLAILTGDQAFCSTCFRCRNCKRKIENLRYARTSQGIFCMGCHESLMARRRKKSKAAAAAQKPGREKSHSHSHSPMVTEKSLPALPPNVIPNGAFSDDKVDPDSDTPTELSPRPRLAHRHTESSSRSSSRPGARSPDRRASSSRPEGLGLSQRPYRSNRSSTIMSGGDTKSDDPDSFFIPVALDPSPVPRSSADDKAKNDYFSIPKAGDKRESHASTPHIAFQDKARQHSNDNDLTQLKSLSHSVSRSSKEASPSGLKSPQASGRGPQSDDRQLQDAPTIVRDESNSSASSQDAAVASARKDSNVMVPPPRAPRDARPQEPVEGGTSLDRTISHPEQPKAITRKQLPPTAANNGKGPDSGPSRFPTNEGFIVTPKPGQSPSSDDPPPKPPRPGAPDASSRGDTYMRPRVAPAPPPVAQTPGKTNKDDPMSPKESPKLPRWSSGGDFSMDEDMARILGMDDRSSKIMRRASNIARHGRTSSIESSVAGNPTRASHARSISETTRTTTSPRWSKHQHHDDRNGTAPEIASPASSSGDDAVLLKRQLKNSEQRVAELERQFNNEKDLQTLNKKLIEKRKTVSVLDTQAEVMIQQLEVLAGYVEKAKETKSSVDPQELQDAALKDFVQKLEKVKMSMSETIEQLHEERDKLIEEKLKAMTDRDRALQEFEQLSSKNAQLADMNNDLTHQIQERFKAQGVEAKALNGLGIYGDNKSAMGSSSNLDAASMSTGPTLLAADEDTIVESGPTVVQVRKGQVKKFNWKKGSKGLAQNLQKGVNRAAAAFQNDRGERITPGAAAMPGGDIGMPYNATIVQAESPAGPTVNTLKQHQNQHMNQQQGGEHGRQGFGFFSKKSATTVPKSASTSAVSTPAPVEPPTTLFGSDLGERAEYERRQIPSVVTRCIEEVELRGMDQEGIYRKTGGNSQINAIKEGFDKDEDYDISDPDLDITAVTSVLKQYFRKLPVPLLTFDIYERILESTCKYTYLLFRAWRHRLIDSSYHR